MKYKMTPSSSPKILSKNAKRKQKRMRKKMKMQKKEKKEKNIINPEFKFDVSGRKTKAEKAPKFYMLNLEDELSNESGSDSSAEIDFVQSHRNQSKKDKVETTK